MMRLGGQDQIAKTLQQVQGTLTFGMPSNAVPQKANLPPGETGHSQAEYQRFLGTPMVNAICTGHTVQPSRMDFRNGDFRLHSCQPTAECAARYSDPLKFLQKRFIKGKSRLLCGFTLAADACAVVSN
eukprot:3118985-Rhodomonas_salina.1